LVATVWPLFTVIISPVMEKLAELYAIGVVGAVTVNLSMCAISFDLPMKRYERAGIGALALLMLAIWVTIAGTKLHDEVDCPRGQQQPQSSAQKRQQKTLGEQLSDQPARACADRCANGHLFHPRL
jgi:hypothetical protein